MFHLFLNKRIHLFCVLQNIILLLFTDLVCITKKMCEKGDRVVRRSFEGGIFVERIST